MGGSSERSAGVKQVLRPASVLVLLGLVARGRLPSHPFCQGSTFTYSVYDTLAGVCAKVAWQKAVKPAACFPCV